MLSSQHRSQKMLAFLSLLPDLVSLNDIMSNLVDLPPGEYPDAFENIKQLHSHLIKTAADISFILSVVGFGRRSAVLQVIKTLIPALIKDMSDIEEISRGLQPDERAVLFENIEELRLAEVIKTAADIPRILSVVGFGRRSAVCQVIKTLIPTLIKDMSDIEEISRGVMPHERADVFENIEELRLAEFIKTAADIPRILSAVGFGQRSAVFQVIKTLIPALIKDMSDIEEISRGLQSHESAVVLENIERPLTEFINTAADIPRMLRAVGFGQRSAVLQVIKTLIPALITEVSDLNKILQALNLDERAVVLENIEGLLTEVIKTVADIPLILEYFDFEQRLVACQVIKTLIPKLITEVSDIEKISRAFEPHERDVVFENIEGPLTEVIKTAADIPLILKHLNPEQRLVACLMIQTLIPALITKVSEIKEISQGLTRDECAVMFENIEGLLHGVIKTTADIRLILELEYFDYERRLVACQVIKTLIPGLIAEGFDIKEISQWFTDVELAILFGNIKAEVIEEDANIDDAQSEHEQTYIYEDNDYGDYSGEDEEENLSQSDNPILKSQPTCTLGMWRTTCERGEVSEEKENEQKLKR